MGLRWKPAEIRDVLEAVDGEGRPQVWRRSWYGFAARQLTMSEAMTCRDAAGRMVMVTGLAAWPDHWEGWMYAGPGLRPNLLAALRDWRAVLDRQLIAREGTEVRAYVVQGGVAGRRLAAWLGFEDAGDDPHEPDVFRVFRRRAG